MSSTVRAGLLYARARYLDPAIGRWTSVEPLLNELPPNELLKIRGGQLLATSPYNYTFNNPVNLTDPDGKCPDCVLDGIAIGLSAKDFYDNPTWGNAGWLAADVLGAALPFIPSPGAFRHGARVLMAADHMMGGGKALNKLDDLIGSFRGPARRHDAARVTQKTLTRETNTVIMPGVDVAGDVAAINSGQVRRVGETFTVNGRTYQAKPDGTLFPVSGEGIVQLDRGGFKALGVLNEHGNTARAQEILSNMGINDEAREAALGVWRALQR